MQILRRGPTVCLDDRQFAPVSRLDHQLREVHLTPSQDFQFIGMQFNTRQFTVAPLPKMRLKVQSVHQHWMTNPVITTRATQIAGHEIPGCSVDEVVRSQGDNTGSRPSARSSQRPGKFAVQGRPDTEHRVDDGHGVSPTSVCPVWRTTGRLVCDVCQQTPYQVCIAVSGLQGGVHGRHVSSMRQREGPPVRISAVQGGPLSPAEGRSVSRCSDDSDCSSAGNSFLVPGTSGPVPRRSHPAARRRSATADSGRRSVRRGVRDSSLPPVKSSRLETLRAILVAKGHSREAAEMMSRSLQESSLHVYESHWARFISSCRSKRWHVFRVRSHHFSTYMMHLFRDGLIPSTIISHRTSVASVLRHWVYDPAADLHIKLLIRAFWLERLVQRRIMPKWDLHLVLTELMSLPFAWEVSDQAETSDDIIPLKWQTMKTMFLLTLASARRRSYLHALSVAPGRCVFSRGNTQRQLMVSLLPEAGFLAKNQLPSQAPQWISVPGMAHLIVPTLAQCWHTSVGPTLAQRYANGGMSTLYQHWPNGGCVTGFL